MWRPLCSLDDSDIGLGFLRLAGLSSDEDGRLRSHIAVCMLWSLALHSLWP